MEFAAQPEALLNKTFQMEKPVESTVNQVIAPFYLRCTALCIDYMLLLLPPVAVLVLSKFFGESAAKSDLPNYVWYLVLILWIVDFLALPLFSGQTFGKMLAGITMLKTDGSPVRLGSLLRRNVLGYFLTIITLGLGFLLAVLNKNGRSLHDYVGGTIVIQGRRRRA